MRKVNSFTFLVLAGWLALAATAPAQPRPYVGFVYPAGGQRGTTVQIQLGGHVGNIGRVVKWQTRYP